MARVGTGIPGLDGLMGGGFLENSVNLLSGSPGTGKSIFTQQFIYSGAMQGEKGMYVSFEEKVPNIYERAGNFGWDFASLEKKGLVKFDFIDISQRRVIDGKTFIDLIRQNAQAFGAKRLVIDSISALSNFPISLEELMSYGVFRELDKFLPVPMEMMTRIQVHRLIMNLRDIGCTSLITSELPKSTEWLSRDTISEFLADSVIVLHYLGMGESRRSLLIEKMRGSAHYEEYVPLEIQDRKGIVLKQGRQGAFPL